jgi:acyl-CoA hydrolase
MCARSSELHNVEITHLHTEGTSTYAKPEYSDSFHVNVFFVAKNIRPFVEGMNVQYIPMFLSEIPMVIRKGKFPIDVAMIQVSPPDAHGFCSLGVSVDVTKAACESAKRIIAQINPNMPRSLGDGVIHESAITAAVYCDDPIFEVQMGSISEVEMKIGKNVAELVEDGATLQMGIGAIPNAVLQFLTNHRDLGVHTEMFSDGILPLVETGVINGRVKKKHPGKIVSSFVLGSRKLYDVRCCLCE